MSYRNPFTAARVKRETIFYVPGEPETIKADCKEGLFLPLGEKSEVQEGKKYVPNPNAKSELNLQVVKYGNYQGAVLFPAEDGERKRHNWTQIFWIDDRGVLCSTLLKGESRDNFLKLVRDIEIKYKGEKRFVDFIIKATMARRDSKKFNSKYFAIEFEVANEIPEATFNRNLEFAKEAFDDILCRRTIVEYVQQNVPNYEAHDMALMSAELLHAFGFIPHEKVAQLAGGSNPVVAALAETVEPETAEQ